MKPVSAGILRAPIALTRKNTKMIQKTSRPTPLATDAFGITLSTYLLASESRTWR